MYHKARVRPGIGSSEIHSHNLFPWSAGLRAPFEGAWITIAPNGSTRSDDHYEYETFFIIEGEGELVLDGETKAVIGGDVFFIPPFSAHKLTNLSPTKALLYLAIWWEGEKSFPPRRRSGWEAMPQL